MNIITAPGKLLPPVELPPGKFQPRTKVQDMTKIFKSHEKDAKKRIKLLFEGNFS